jgi:CysZ protein
MRAAFRPTVLLAGAMLAGLVLVPVLNLLTPLFGVALMVHLHKGLSGRFLPDRDAAGAPRLEAGIRAR